jgi:hypothetical protein
LNLVTLKVAVEGKEEVMPFDLSERRGRREVSVVGVGEHFGRLLLLLCEQPRRLSWKEKDQI